MQKPPPAGSLVGRRVPASAFGNLPVGCADAQLKSGHLEDEGPLYLFLVLPSALRYMNRKNPLANWSTP